MPNNVIVCHHCVVGLFLLEQDTGLNDGPGCHKYSMIMPSNIDEDWDWALRFHRNNLLLFSVELQAWREEREEEGQEEGEIVKER